MPTWKRMLLAALAELAPSRRNESTVDTYSRVFAATIKEHRAREAEKAALADPPVSTRKEYIQ